MAVDLAPGFYRDEESSVYLVTSTGDLWLVDAEGAGDLPWPLEERLTFTVGLEPYPDIDPAEADEYRRMVDPATGPEAGRTWRDRPPML